MVVRTYKIESTFMKGNDLVYQISLSYNLISLRSLIRIFPTNLLKIFDRNMSFKPSLGKDLFLELCMAFCVAILTGTGCQVRCIYYLKYESPNIAPGSLDLGGQERCQ